jgi:hypothetical protein
MSRKTISVNKGRWIGIQKTSFDNLVIIIPVGVLQRCCAICATRHLRNLTVVQPEPNYLKDSKMGCAIFVT